MKAKFLTSNVEFESSTIALILVTILFIEMHKVWVKPLNIDKMKRLLLTLFLHSFHVRTIAFMRNCFFCFKNKTLTVACQNTFTKTLQINQRINNFFFQKKSTCCRAIWIQMRVFFQTKNDWARRLQSGLHSNESTFLNQKWYVTKFAERFAFKWQCVL